MVKTVSAEEVAQLKEREDVVLIDVLSEESFETRHIPGAINIPVQAPDFEMMMRQQVPNRRSTVIVYCSDAECKASPRAAKALTDMGYEDVREFTEGLAGWREARYPFEDVPRRVKADFSR